MDNKIKFFEDGSYLEYGPGKFDDWCVYLVQPTGVRRPPRDTDYFSELKCLSEKYGCNKIYSDYVCIYNITGNKVEKSALKYIDTIASSYGDDALTLNVIFTVLYMAMISEENKKNTRLGKRIKRLGIFKLLVESCSVIESANFMRGMHWYEIDRLCKEQGF